MPEYDRCPDCKGLKTRYVLSLKLKCYAVYCYDCDRLYIIEEEQEATD